jgi:NAD(P)-dependent dehydrogenase (short-subunit alcohol dehydrogenase family)
MKTVLITGGNKGIGLETTRFFLERNYKVIVVARDFTEFEFTAHDQVQSIQFDITQIGDIPDLIAASPTETDMLATIPEARKAIFKQSVISNRFATAQEVAAAIGWLGAEAPEYINGICIDINNGSFLR